MPKLDLERLVPVADELFFSRNDPNDVRLGDVVQRGSAAYARASVVILGFPEDEGVRRNGGRPGAAAAPAAIRHCLYRMGSAGLTELAIVDLGDTAPAASLEARHAWHMALVAQIIADGKRLLVLGGGNDVAYPDYAGLAAAAGPALALNLDAHYDVRADTPRNSGTPYRQLIDEGRLAPTNYHVIGAQPFANSPVYTAFLAKFGAQVTTLQMARAEGVTATVERITTESSATTIFWGFDMDVVNAAEAPGVSAPNPLGMRGDEFCALAELAGRDPRTRLIELSEVCPPYDLDLRTCRLAAAMLWYALLGFAG
ncbi:formimidoylglutamase [Candidatus Chloroploca sp. Khr17]|uniref:formimidoylglutamase n=1 Tax=Candidatus Chloroploca sp. Khr17 TaxID=2496869 RepID=UPI00101B8DDF|nr:formimidoylglutamase [Candidatus Chloroploca sp. Khr17]